MALSFPLEHRQKSFAETTVAGRMMWGKGSLNCSVLVNVWMYLPYFLSHRKFQLLPYPPPPTHTQASPTRLSQHSILEIQALEASSKPLMGFLREALEPGALSRTMSLLFQAHMSRCTLSDWSVILLPADRKIHLFPPGHQGLDFGPLGFSRAPGDLKRLPGEGTVFTTNRGIAHLWRAAVFLGMGV